MKSPLFGFWAKTILFSHVATTLIVSVVWSQEEAIPDFKLFSSSEAFTPLKVLASDAEPEHDIRVRNVVRAR